MAGDLPGRAVDLPGPQQDFALRFLQGGDKGQVVGALFSPHGHDQRLVDDRLVAHDDSLLDDVPQFPRVPRKGVAEQQFDPSGGDAFVGLVLGVVEIQELLGQVEDVLGPGPQGRYLDGQGVQPVIEVLAEESGPDLLLEVAVRGRDDGAADLARAGSADGHEFVLVETLEKLGLQVQGHLAQFVQEEGAVCSHLHEPGLALLQGAREGAALVAEELGLEQRFRQGGAVHGDEGAFAALAVLVDELGHHALARARFAQDEDLGGVEVCQLHGLGDHAAHALALHGQTLGVELEHGHPGQLVLDLGAFPHGLVQVPAQDVQLGQVPFVDDHEGDVALLVEGRRARDQKLLARARRVLDDAGLLLGLEDHEGHGLVDEAAGHDLAHVPAEQVFGPDAVQAFRGLVDGQDAACAVADPDAVVGALEHGLEGLQELLVRIELGGQFLEAFRALQADDGPDEAAVPHVRRDLEEELHAAVDDAPAAVAEGFAGQGLPGQGGGDGKEFRGVPPDAILEAPSLGFEKGPGPFVQEGHLAVQVHGHDGVADGVDDGVEG